MGFNLRNRSFTTLLDFTPREIRFLLDLSARPRSARSTAATSSRGCRARTSRSSSRRRRRGPASSFEVAAYDQGAHVTYLGPSGTQIGHKESMKDTARVLGRIYDGIEYRGFGQEIVEELAKYAGVPVWNGLTDEFHPTQILADVLTMTESQRQAADARSRTATSATPATTWATRCWSAAAKLGMDVRLCAPKDLWPDEDLVDAVPGDRRGDRRPDHPDRRRRRGRQGRRLPVHRRVGLDGRGQVGLGRAGQAPHALPGQQRRWSRRPATRT